MSTNIERLVTSGTFELDGGSWDVYNNIWIVGDDKDVVVPQGLQLPGEIPVP